MTTHVVKLIRITAGLYRTEDFGFVVARQFAERNDPAHWVVKFTNGFGEKIRKPFATLDEAREFLDSTEYQA